MSGLRVSHRGAPTAALCRRCASVGLFGALNCSDDLPPWKYSLFFSRERRVLMLALVYDMLPALFASSQAGLPDRRLHRCGPTAHDLHFLERRRSRPLGSWVREIAARAISDSLRIIARNSLAAGRAARLRFSERTPETQKPLISQRFSLAQGEIRTLTPHGATPSRWCVYQFHHLGVLHMKF